MIGTLIPVASSIISIVSKMNATSMIKNVDDQITQLYAMMQQLDDARKQAIKDILELNMDIDEKYNMLKSQNILKENDLRRLKEYEQYLISGLEYAEKQLTEITPIVDELFAIRDLKREQANQLTEEKDQLEDTLRSLYSSLNLLKSDLESLSEDIQALEEILANSKISYNATLASSNISAAYSFVNGYSAKSLHYMELNEQQKFKLTYDIALYLYNTSFYGSCSPSHPEDFVTPSIIMVQSLDILRFMAQQDSNPFLDAFSLCLHWASNSPKMRRYSIKDVTTVDDCLKIHEVINYTHLLLDKPTNFRTINLCVNIEGREYTESIELCVAGNNILMHLNAQYYNFNNIRTPYSILEQYLLVRAIEITSDMTWHRETTDANLVKHEYWSFMFKDFITIDGIPFVDFINEQKQIYNAPENADLRLALSDSYSPEKRYVIYNSNIDAFEIHNGNFVLYDQHLFHTINSFHKAKNQLSITGLSILELVNWVYMPIDTEEGEEAKLAALEVLIQNYGDNIREVMTGA